MNMTLSLEAIQWIALHQPKGFPWLGLSLKRTGCSGWAYHFQWYATYPAGFLPVHWNVQDDVKNEHQAIGQDEPCSFGLLVDAEHEHVFDQTYVDLKRTPFETQLVWKHPQEPERCGCGKSVHFS